MTDRDPARESVHDDTLFVRTYSDEQAQFKIREGLRLVLTGLEELWKLPRSVETKREQGRR